MKFFTGIGSRKTPSSILDIMDGLCGVLIQRGYALRSGGARGADNTFEQGYKTRGGSFTIILPFTPFNGRHADGVNYSLGVTKESLKTVEMFHPNPRALSATGRKLMARNYYQIVDFNGVQSSFVICYAVNNEGGTGQAIRIASKLGIPVYNMWFPRIRKMMEKLI